MKNILEIFNLIFNLFSKIIKVSKNKEFKNLFSKMILIFIVLILNSFKFIFFIKKSILNKIYYIKTKDIVNIKYLRRKYLNLKKENYNKDYFIDNNYNINNWISESELYTKQLRKQIYESVNKDTKEYILINKSIYIIMKYHFIQYIIFGCHNKKYKKKLDVYIFYDFVYLFNIDYESKKEVDLLFDIYNKSINIIFNTDENDSELNILFLKLENSISKYISKIELIELENGIKNKA